jgi:hypothetical protein
MSEQYFYVGFKFSPKFGVHTVRTTRGHEAIVEVPKELVRQKQLESINEHAREKVIALDFARRAALATFSSSVDDRCPFRSTSLPLCAASRASANSAMLRRSSG